MHTHRHRFIYIYGNVIEKTFYYSVLQTFYFNCLTGDKGMQTYIQDDNERKINTVTMGKCYIKVAVLLHGNL